MLAADRQAVETDLQAQAVQIKNIEMNNIDRYLQAISTQAALICGFAAAESFAVELARSPETLWWLTMLVSSQMIVSVSTNCQLTCSRLTTPSCY